MADEPRDPIDVPTQLGTTQLGETGALQTRTNELEATQVAGEGTPTSRDEAPRKIGRFAVLRLLGAGGMGVVYAAYDEELDRRVAIKLLQTRRGADNSQGHTRLLREAQAMAKLAHPNIAAVFEVGLWSGQVYLAMEFVAGKSLGEWLAAGPRAWPEVLGVFLQAGRGLAAAHASGLVHRDFKPDNAIVGDDGRVRVLDFGLARAASEISREPAVVPAMPDAASLTGSVLSAPLTMTGAVLGTPAYMAPEQHRGEPADARSDQFSFCVSLYEALYGCRPFAGEDLVELVYHVLAGEVRAPPRERKVPARVHAAVLRGLASDPAARWPDMPALLDALAVDPARRRQRWLVAAGIAVSLIAGVAGATELRARGAERCGGAQAQIDVVWSDERRASVDAALLATGVSYAADTASRVRQELDAYALAWAAGHRDACEATVVRQEQSEAVRDDRMLCLAQRRRQFDALVELLTRADREIVASAVEAARSLPGVEACADFGYLAASVKPPEDPGAALQMHALQQGLAAVQANSSAGRYRQAEALLRPISGAADALGYTPLTIQVAVRRTNLLERLGRFAEAATVGEQAFFDARVAGLEAEAGELAGDLVTVVGERLERPVEGLIWARHALASLQRLADPLAEARLLRASAAVRLHQSDLPGAAADLQRSLEIDRQRATPDPLRLASAARALGMLRGQQGKHAEAEALLREAIELRAGVLGAEHPTMGELYNMHAGELDALARRDEALVELERALAMHLRDGGEDHPWTGSDLQDIGQILQAQGKLPEAFEHMQRALAAYRRTVAGDHPTIAIVYGNMATVLSKLGRHAEAREYLHRTLDIFRATYGESHAQVARAYINLGVQHKIAGDYTGAAAYYDRGLAALERKLGPKHPALGQLHGNVGNLRVLQGRLGEARDEYLRALEILEVALGEKHPELSPVLAGLSDVARAQRQPAVALAYAERAVALFTGVEKPDPRLVGQSEFAVAESLTAARREPERARAHALRAREAYVAAGPGAAENLAAVEAWLSRRR